MPRYIDADALKENLNEIARHSFTLDDDYQYFIKGLIRADDAINETPTADVWEEVHARWETEVITDALGKKHAYFACSRCGRGSADETPYCSYCGAQMD